MRGRSSTKVNNPAAGLTHEVWRPTTRGGSLRLFRGMALGLGTTQSRVSWQEIELIVPPGTTFKNAGHAPEFPFQGSTISHTLSGKRAPATNFSRPRCVDAGAISFGRSRPEADIRKIMARHKDVQPTAVSTQLP
jgi:hypothetical protein